MPLPIDADIKLLTPAQLRREVVRLRNAIRRHRNAKGNARCWHNDLQLYEKTLPEAPSAGRMDEPEDILLRNCRRYIRRQQCDRHGCAHKCKK